MKTAAYPQAKKLIRLQCDGSRPVKEFNHDFASTCKGLCTSLIADSTEPIKALPDCILRGLHLDAFDSSFSNLKETIESQDDMKFSKAADVMEIRDKQRKSPATGTAAKAHGIHKPGTTGNFGCFNCGGSHNERQCSKPCKVCGKPGHTRHSCPDRKRRNPRTRSGTGAGVTAVDVRSIRDELAHVRNQLTDSKSNAAVSVASTSSATKPPGSACYAIARGRGGYRGVVNDWRDCS